MASNAENGTIPYHTVPAVSQACTVLSLLPGAILMSTGPVTWGTLHLALRMRGSARITPSGDQCMKG